MGQRLGGILKISYDGIQIPAKGSFVGYTEKPRVPSIKGEITTRNEISLETLLAITNSTITADLANGHSYVLTEAWTKGTFEIDTSEGKFEIEFSGVTCEEI